MSTQGAILKALKKLGWARRSTTASLRGDDAVVVVSFQKSRYGSVVFVNVGIWLLALGDAGEFPKHTQCHLQFRLERLFPELLPVLSPDGSLAELESQMLDNNDDLQGMTKLTHLRQMYSTGRLTNGLVRQEARAILALP